MQRSEIQGNRGESRIPLHFIRATVPRGNDALVRERQSPDYLLSGTSFFLSLPAMYGLHGAARTGPLVFHTTLN